MSNLTTLLPQSHIRALRHAYLVRLLVLVLTGLTIFVWVHGVLLIPSLQYYQEQEQSAAEHLEALTLAEASSEEGEITTRLAAMEVQAETLQAFLLATPASASLRAILAVSRPGIALTSLSVSPGTEGKMLLTGTADSRDALRAYYAALEALPAVSRVDLPLDAYAKESAIPFSMTLIGTLTP